jgi:hypothetical protein
MEGSQEIDDAGGFGAVGSVAADLTSFSATDRVETPVKWPLPVEQSEGTSSSRLRDGLRNVLYSITDSVLLLLLMLLRDGGDDIAAAGAVTGGCNLLPGEINRPLRDTVARWLLLPPLLLSLLVLLSPGNSAGAAGALPSSGAKVFLCSESSSSFLKVVVEVSVSICLSIASATLLLFASASLLLGLFAADTIWIATTGVSIALIILMDSGGVTVLAAPVEWEDEVVSEAAAAIDVDFAFVLEFIFNFNPSDLPGAGLALAGTRVLLRVTWDDSAWVDVSSSCCESPLVTAATAGGPCARAGVAYEEGSSEVCRLETAASVVEACTEVEFRALRRVDRCIVGGVTRNVIIKRQRTKRDGIQKRKNRNGERPRLIKDKSVKLERQQERVVCSFVMVEKELSRR